MARIKLSLPDHFAFHTDIPIRIGDINYGGHLGNDSILSIAHEARLRFFSQYGFSEKDVAGVGIIMVDALINYMSEGFYGMTLRVEVAVSDMQRIGCDILYRMTDTESGREIARVKTGIVFIDREMRKTVEIPAAFRELFVS